MTIEAQISRFTRCVEGLARSIASLNDDLYFRKLHAWSPRDILAHLVGWNRYVIRGCQQIKNGELPSYDIDPGENFRNINAVLVREYPSCDKQELLGQLGASAQEL